jgi:ABC-type transport system involved in Fe-S cluster assembly fused permease/ATPase subunit
MILSIICPNGFSTYMASTGLHFRGGEKQRIAIARALYKDPESIDL